MNLCYKLYKGRAYLAEAVDFESLEKLRLEFPEMTAGTVYLGGVFKRLKDSSAEFSASEVKEGVYTPTLNIPEGSFTLSAVEFGCGTVLLSGIGREYFCRLERELLSAELRLDRADKDIAELKEYIANGKTF